MRTDRKMTLAVTGGIGSGKSLVCSILGRNGFPVYDSDSRTKDLYLSVPGLSGRISDALGIDLCRPDGTLDRAGLAAVVFSDPDKLRLLESIVYPEVKTDFLKWKENTPEDCIWVVMESAVILEKPFFRDLIDKVLLVDADGDVKVGAPYVEGAVVKATVVDDSCRAKKVLIFKKKRRKGYQKLTGHRQNLSKIQINEIA